MIGRRAEQVASEYLERLQFDILDRNWRQRDCEIDIVAYKQQTLYFVEVKYRSRDNAGSGLDYIGPHKIRRMAYAARRWLQMHNWRGSYQLAALEVSDNSFEVTAFIDCIDAW